MSRRLPRDKSALAKGKPYSFQGERQILSHRRTSSRIYENGKLPNEIKSELTCDPSFHRFQGVLTTHHWSVADVVIAWPEIEKLRAEQDKLEDAKEAAGSNRMLRGKVKSLRRTVNAMAAHIDVLAMKPPPSSA